MTDIPKEEFPALGAKTTNSTATAKPAESAKGKTEESKGGSKLKVGSRAFTAKSYTPKPPPKINHYISHMEPSIKEQEFFPTLDGKMPEPDPAEAEAKAKHEEFLARHDLFKPYISLIEKELWYVPDECIDALGYPMMANLPQLYMYLWNSYNVFFTQEGTWAVPAETVMATLGELWTHAEWRDRVIMKEQKEMEAWLKENDDYYDEEDEEYDPLDPKYGKGDKKKQKKKKKNKKKGPPPSFKAKESYKRFQVPKDENVIAKPKSDFKEVSELMNEDEIHDVDETRDPSSLVFIGHVDVGKSTICGNLMFMTGMVDERTIEKFRKEAIEKGRDSWWLAYVMDINDDEKAKGKTVEVGRATLETDHKRYTIFDAPGHKNYVPDMIMGAAMADAAALVISARKGEYESGFEGEGQTREHAMLARSLGVDKLIVVVNKMDEESVDWDENRYNEILEGVTPFLIEECGYKKEDILYIPVSGLTGENIDKVGPSAPWYTGPSLIDILDKVETPQRNPDGHIRIPILDKMKEKRVVAFGKVESGTVEIGSKLSVMPNDIHCQVTNIYNCKQESVKYAKPGENVQIKLRMIDDENLINKGDVLCNFDNPCPMAELFEAEIQLLGLLPHRQIVTPGYKSMMHLHTIVDEIVIKGLSGIYEKDGDGREYLKKNPKYAKSGSKILAKISTRVQVCLEKYQDIEHMGRFTLRDEGKTIALGKILRYKPAVKKDEKIEEEKKLFEEIQAKKAEEEEKKKKKELEMKPTNFDDMFGNEEPGETQESSEQVQDPETPQEPTSLAESAENTTDQ